MKVLTLLMCGLLLMSFVVWETDFEKAKRQAKEKDELILLNFSGSDWCGPCVRLRKEIFESTVFSQMADSNLVLVNADFREKKRTD
jgi:thioredoxin-related protein